MRFFTFILRNVFRRRVRSTLTMTGMAVAVGAVVALVGISDGFHRSMLELYQRRGVNLIVSRSDNVNPLSGALPEQLGTDIAKLEGVEGICPGLVDVLSFENLQLENIVTQGWPAGTFMFDELNLLDGDRLSAKYQGKNAIMLGKDLAKVGNLKVGDKVEMVGENFHVVGVYETFAGLENNMVIMLLDDAQRLTGKPKQITGCTVKIKNVTPERVQEMKALIEGPVAERLHLSGKIRAAEPGDMLKNNTQINMGKAMAWMTSAVALFIGTIGVLNTMVMSVFERTREIGILRAIGWQPRRVMRMILLESMLLSLAGGVAGTVGGLGLIWFLSRLPRVNGAIPATASPKIILMGFIIAVLVGLIGAAYPAYRGARLLPTEALRHE